MRFIILCIAISVIWNVFAIFSGFKDMFAIVSSGFLIAIGLEIVLTLQDILEEIRKRNKKGDV